MTDKDGISAETLRFKIVVYQQKFHWGTTLKSKNRLLLYSKWLFFLYWSNEDEYLFTILCFEICKLLKLLHISNGVFPNIFDDFGVGCAIGFLCCADNHIISDVGAVEKTRCL